MNQRVHVRLHRSVMRALLLTLLTAACAALGSGPGTLESESKLMHTSQHTGDSVDPRTLTSSPLRNRIRVELRAPVSEVWALIGDLSRLPEYSSGLERVEAKRDSRGTLSGYVCHFRPQEQETEGIVHRERIRWYERDRGYASSGEEGNVFGLTNDLNLVTVEPSREGTILKWEEYYDAEDLDMNKASYDEALADIAANLIRRFGGRLIERYVEQQR